MGYVTPEQITQAKELDLLTYLQRFDPHALVHVGGSTYCTREHDSLKISNGKWNWFSREIGGKTALDYLIKVQGFSFTQAVETLVGRAAVLPPVSHAAPKPAPPRKLLMPELNSNNDVVLNYLMGRGIHPVVLDFCLEHKLLFETKQYHNALFAEYGREGKMRYAALRGTLGDFKGEVTGSDKHYSFSIAAPQESGRLHLFESAIDLLSYATLMLGRGWDWQKDSLLSLAFGASRSSLTGQIEGGKVFVNGRLAASSSCQPKEGDLISVRGMGRFRLQEIGGQSKKGRIYVTLFKYI